MAHTPEIVETKEHSDEQVGYRIRCCGDPTTDSWHTFTILDANIDLQLVDRKATVAARHAAKVAWRAAQSGAAIQASATVVSHTPAVVETKELHDEGVSYLIRCCDDPTTDCSLAISLWSVATKDSSNTWDQQLSEKLTEVAQKHEAKLAWRLKQQQALPAQSTSSYFFE